VVAKEGYTYQWVAEGGNVINGQGSAAIEINWGKSRPDAFVQVTATNPSGCKSQSVLRVRINTILQPEEPQGAGLICVNNRDGQLYTVTSTNGSIYTWGIEGGVLVQGQGTSQIRVNWNGEGIHRLWLQEKNITIDTAVMVLLIHWWFR
jgi:hypothetical protein